MSGTSSPTAVATDDDALARAGLARALATAPIMSRGAALALGTAPRTASLLGTQLNASGGDLDIDSRVYLNPSLPWTAVVLGQQVRQHCASASTMQRNDSVLCVGLGFRSKPLRRLSPRKLHRPRCTHGPTAKAYGCPSVRIFCLQNGSALMPAQLHV